ncbi:efflux RND transporter permease subunit [Paraburkholderia sp. PREW-6R]|uniref:efflux RND transporter permease subunit n=1 Tax=Paraburkholderia sp. PREW-6R TaxID=3141544 RepID=UPI0031F4C023
MTTPIHEGRANLSAWALRHRALVVFITALTTLMGILAYTRLAQSEDPPFTLRVMVIQTRWPGATARQMQEEVTDRISRKLEELPSTDYLNSYSRPGESTIFFAMKDSLPATEIQPTWYQVRKKVGDLSPTLPMGVQGPYFNDEFGDVYTHLYVLSGDGFSPAQLHDYADTLRTALLRVPGVAKVDYFGDPDEHFYIDIPNAKLAALGVSPQRIADAIRAQNAIAYAGMINTSGDRVQVRTSGQFRTEAQLAGMLLRIDGHTFRLGDIATITRGDDDPPLTQMRFEGQAVLGIGITMKPDGDVLRLGHALDAETRRLQSGLPAGLKLVQVANMSHAVADSVDDFLEAVAEAIAIVLAVSLLSLGVRAGLIVAISVPVVLAVTATCMQLFDIGLNKVSLGTLVLSLGLLVDDAIIAVETMIVKLSQGWDRARAAAFAYTSTAFPMLTGTLVTVAGFLPIVLARSSTGEYTRAIFQVSSIALLASWLAAVALIPLLGYWLLPEHRPAATHPSRATPVSAHEHALYGTLFYRRLQGWIGWCVARRWIVLTATALLFIVSLAGFALVPQQFFPSSDRPELLVDVRLPESASFEATLSEAKRFEHALNGLPGIDHSISFVGTGAPRFYLPLNQQLPQPNVAQFVVTAKSAQEREKLATKLERLLAERFPALRTRLTRLESGPPVGYAVQFRVMGPDLATVRRIARKVDAVMRASPATRDVHLNSDGPSERSVSVEINETKARELEITSEDVSNLLAMTLSGYPVTQYRERDRLIGVELRAPRSERSSPGALASLSVPTPHGAVTLGTLAQIRYGLEDSVIWERNGQPAVTVQSDVRGKAQGIDVGQAIDRQLDALRSQLPDGYRIEMGGPAEESARAQASIAAQMPVMLIVVLTLLMIQLQSFSRVMMVLTTAPLGLIGVVAALLLFGKPFGFAAMLGVIAMFGIIMRNSVILVDQIEKDIASGQPRGDAIVDATVRRFRPIMLTAAAAVLALVPLLSSNFFGAMATALMGGITCATLLTVVYVPALYAAAFRVRPNECGVDARPEAEGA